MESSSFDDCYFYYYSSCTKGTDCPFRHCEAALGTETVCSLWREGLCYRSNCKFRHMESRINRASISCYWENQPGGCRKPHCVFFHHKERLKMDVFNETGGGLILPIASQPVSPVRPLDSSVENKWESSESLSLSPSSHAIQPVVVSLDGEESDNESTASTPMKVNPNLEKKFSSPSKTVNTAANGSSSDVDLGIKTLEQIKMAKIHRESEHFYNPGKTDVAIADTSSECARLETMHNEPNSYYSQEFSMPASEVTPMELENESYQNASLYPTEMNNILHGCSKSPEPALGDLRDILKKRKRHVPEKKRVATELSTKRIISLKKSPGAVEDESPALTVTVGKGTEVEKKELSQVVYAVKMQSRSEGDIGFRVKTLDEIRREKEKRQSGKIAPFSTEEVPVEEDNMDKSIENFLGQMKEHSSENKMKSKGSKRKLRRRPLELYRSLQKQTTSDFEASKESAEQDLSQMSEDIMFADEAVAKDVSVEVTVGMKEREGSNSNNSMKRVFPDVPIATKAKKLTEVHRIANQKATASEIDGDKSPKSVDANQKVDSNSLKFKRQNIIHKKNVSETLHVSEDSSSQLENSELQTELVQEIPEVSVLPSQNGTCSNSDDCSAETKDVEMSNEEENANSPAPSAPAAVQQCENRLPSLSTVDELDTLFLGSETDMCLDEIDTNPDTKAEDLFLEFEQMLQS